MNTLFIKVAKAILLISVLSACESGTPTNLASPSPSATLSASPSPSPIAKTTFEITSFDLSYQNNTQFKDETYTGNGIITANGFEPKKPYYVLISINKMSGGSKSSTGERTENVVVVNGVGKFSTSDWNYDNTYKMEKPVYEFKVLGYIAYLPN